MATSYVAENAISVINRPEVNPPSASAAISEKKLMGGHQPPPPPVSVAKFNFSYGVGCRKKSYVLGV